MYIRYALDTNLCLNLMYPPRLQFNIPSYFDSGLAQKTWVRESARAVTVDVTTVTAYSQLTVHLNGPVPGPRCLA